MKVFNAFEMLQVLCKHHKQWGMYVSISDTGMEENVSFSEVIKAAPYLNLTEHAQLLMDGGGWLLFNTEIELRKAFRSTKGDDGPTKTNPYNGLANVYAITCSPDGELMDENT